MTTDERQKRFRRMLAMLFRLPADRPEGDVIDHAWQPAPDAPPATLTRDMFERLRQPPVREPHDR